MAPNLPRVATWKLTVWLLCGWFLACSLALKFGAASNLDLDTWTQLRLPRVILASGVGAALAVAGALLQSLFSNPLCDPYVLGVSSGAALGAVVGNLLGFAWNWAGIGGFSFLGAAAFAGVLLGFARGRRVGTMSLLLTGTMLGLLGSSLVALVSAILDPAGVQSAMLWILGDLSRARLQGAVVVVGVTVLGIGLALRDARGLDALLLGEEGARALGVDVQKLRTRTLLVTALLIGIAVSSSGMIGFLGLVVPHGIRRMGVVLHASLIPLCAIAGALALVVADGAARVAARPYELPVGVVCALLGAPIFIAILQHTGTGRLK